ncbi:hypothetical protein PENTCL1PPCAC_6596, partial [Pristionchus entomophagus]
RTDINNLFLSKIIKEWRKSEGMKDKYETIQNRTLFSRKVLPLGITSDGEAKMVVDSLVPHERRFLMKSLRRKMADEYTES